VGAIPLPSVFDTKLKFLGNSLEVLFAGRKFSEEKLIGCAYAFEQATLKVAEAPGRLTVKPTTDIGSL